MPFMPHWPIFTGTVFSYTPDTTRKILTILGNPQDKLQNIIHITGTNGKGSTAAFCKSILRAHGYRVNVYSSPHLLTYTERIDINNEYISHEKAFYYIESVRRICEEHHIVPTSLEAFTASTILAFSENLADFNIIECCMGGLNDNTNIFSVENTIATVITPLSLDHTKFLGNSITQIAEQKAGIQKAGVISIIAKQPEIDANMFLTQYAHINNIDTLFFGRDYTINQCEIEEKHQDIIKYLEFSCKDHQNIALPMPPLLGDHQIINLSTSVATCIAVLTKTGRDIDYHKFTEGILNTKWRGRLEKIDNIAINDLLPEAEIWFDGAHNPGCASVLAQWISVQSQLENYIIIGKTRDSDQKGFISQFKNIATQVLAIRVRGEINPEYSHTIYASALACNMQAIDAKDLETAIEILQTKGKIRIIICGSLYLLRDIISIEHN